MCLTQKLMDNAYDKWNKSEWNHNQFLKELSEAERVAVVCGNLNYQVCNGDSCNG